MKTTNFSVAYRELLSELARGIVERNARTGVNILMLEGGHSFKLDLNGEIPVAGNRQYFPHIAASETAWQFMGTKDPSFILSKAPKLWSKFVEQELIDGETNPAGQTISVLKTAYGYRWRKAFGRDQLMLAVKELRDNPTNRQLWVQAWDPRCDGLGGPQPKNIPCPIGFSISRSNLDLHMSVFIRSSDVFVGLPYDVMCYALTLDAIAASVGCVPKTIHFTLGHAHLYEPHWGMAEKSYNEEWLDNCSPLLPGFPIQAIESDPEAYVAWVKHKTAFARKHPWNPMPDVIE